MADDGTHVDDGVAASGWLADYLCGGGVAAGGHVTGAHISVNYDA